MNMNSINQPWGISDKYINKYGSLWASIDFILKPITIKSLRDNPTSTVVGELVILQQHIPVTLNDLEELKLILKTNIKNITEDIECKHDIRIRYKSFKMNITEINRLYETVEDSLTSITRKYQLGLYL